tara:strand:- start:472 stop:699 length:228 start_codon:yes stop_codon:yes gene_type:complete
LIFCTLTVGFETAAHCVEGRGSLQAELRSLGLGVLRVFANSAGRSANKSLEKHETNHTFKSSIYNHPILYQTCTT